MGWRDDRRLQVGQFLYSNRTNLVRYQQHQHWCTKQNRTAFHCVLMENEQKTSDKIACFPGAQKRPCGWCCTTVVWSILVFKPYKLAKISTTSASMCKTKQKSFSLRLDAKRTNTKWKKGASGDLVQHLYFFRVGARVVPKNSKWRNNTGTLHIGGVPWPVVSQCARGPCVVQQRDETVPKHCS